MAGGQRPAASGWRQPAAVGGRWQPVHEPPLWAVSKAPLIWERVFDTLLNAGRPPTKHAKPKLAGGGDRSAAPPPTRIDLVGLAEGLESYADQAPQMRETLKAEIVKHHDWLKTDVPQ